MRSLIGFEGWAWAGIENTSCVAQAFIQLAEQRIWISPDPPTDIHELNDIEPALGILCLRDE